MYLYIQQKVHEAIESEYQMNIKVTDLDKLSKPQLNIWICRLVKSAKMHD